MWPFLFFFSVRLAAQKTNKPAPAWLAAALQQEGWLVNWRGEAVPLGQHVSITSFNLHLAETRCCENRQKSLERGFVSFDTHVPRWESTGVVAQIPDKSGCYLNAGLIHHTPLMGLQRQMESKGVESSHCLRSMHLTLLLWER